MDKVLFVIEINVFISDGVIYVIDKFFIFDDIEFLFLRYCNGKKISSVSRERL